MKHFFADSNGAGNLEQLAEINLSTADGAAKAVNVIDMALAKVSQSRSDLGAISNRLDLDHLEPDEHLDLCRICSLAGYGCRLRRRIDQSCTAVRS